MENVLYKIVLYLEAFIAEHLLLHMFFNALNYLLWILIISYLMVYAVLDIYYSIVRKKFLRKTYLFKNKIKVTPWVILIGALFFAVGNTNVSSSFIINMRELHPIIAWIVYTGLCNIVYCIIGIYAFVLVIWFVRWCLRTICRIPRLLYKFHLWLIDEDKD